MKPKHKQLIVVTISLIVTGLLVWGALWIIFAVWRRFAALNESLAVGLLTAASTILVATLTITLGRYFERKKEVEAHFREKKSAIYDSFLTAYFKFTHTESRENVDQVAFLREWQREVILWGGATVLTTYLKWMAHLKKGVPDAQSMFLMDDFFRAIRRDLGLPNRGLERGAFIRLMLRHPDVFFLMARTNPNVKLDAVAQKERDLGLEE